MIYFFKKIVAVSAIIFYFFLSVLAYKELESRSFPIFTRHVIVVPGVVPLLCWLRFLVIGTPRPFYYFWWAVAVTFFHIFVFAVSAHSDGAAYWSVQLIELTALWFIVGGRVNAAKHPRKEQ